METKRFEDFCQYIKKGIFDLSPSLYKEHGVPFIRTSEIKAPLIDYSTTVFIDAQTHSENSKTELRPGDLVFTKIGAYIGDVAMCQKDYPLFNFSQNVAGACLSLKKVDS